MPLGDISFRTGLLSFIRYIFFLDGIARCVPTQRLLMQKFRFLIQFGFSALLIIRKPQPDVSAASTPYFPGDCAMSISDNSFEYYRLNAMSMASTTRRHSRRSFRYAGRQWRDADVSRHRYACSSQAINEVPMINFIAGALLSLIITRSPLRRPRPEAIITIRS